MAVWRRADRARVAERDRRHQPRRLDDGCTCDSLHARVISFGASMSDSTTLKLEGHLYGWWETGTEGVYWSLVTDWGAEHASYENLYPLEDGDELVVYQEDGAVLWSGTISWDWNVRWRSYPLNPEQGQQEVGGMWVHGFQVGVDPEVWADYFMGHELLLRSVRKRRRAGPLRATLIRRRGEVK